jgi:hypothetical protein
MFESAIVKIEIPYNLTLPVNPILDENGNPGEPNPLFPLIAFLNDQVPNFIEGIPQKTYRGSWDLNTYQYVAEISLSLMTIPVISMFLSFGGEIYSLPMWAKVNEEDIVPGMEVTWQEFIEDNNSFTFLEIGNDKYVSTAVLGDGDYLKASSAVEKFGLQNLRTQLQIKALQQSYQPEEVSEE